VDIEIAGLAVIDVVLDDFGGAPFPPSQVPLAAMAERTTVLEPIQTTVYKHMAYDNTGQLLCKTTIVPSLNERAVKVGSDVVGARRQAGSLSDGLLPEDGRRSGQLWMNAQQRMHNSFSSNRVVLCSCKTCIVLWIVSSREGGEASL